jgi:hypothetical protein
MVHQRGLVFDVRMGWTLVPSIGNCGLGSGKITTAAGERQRRGRGRESTEKWGENDEYVLYSVLILF